jgi:hypothetical protein
VRRIGIVAPNPTHHVEDFLAVAGPEMQAIQQLDRVAFARQHVVVQRQRFRPVGFQRKNREAHIRHQEFQQAVLELEELACAMRGLAECDDASLAHNLADRPHVFRPVAGLGRQQRDRAAPKPVDHFRGCLFRLCPRLHRPFHQHQPHRNLLPAAIQTACDFGTIRANRPLKLRLQAAQLHQHLRAFEPDRGDRHIFNAQLRYAKGALDAAVRRHFKLEDHLRRVAILGEFQAGLPLSLQCGVLREYRSATQ